mgnify:CR=1 FL=1
MQLPLIAYISQYSAFLPIIVGFVLFNKIKDWRLWAILFYCLYSFINDEVIVYRVIHHLSYQGFLFIFTLIEFLTFSFFLYSFLKGSLSKKLILTVSILFICFCLYLFVFKLRKDANFDSVQTSVEAIVVIIASLIYLFEEINKPDVTFIYSSYKFWVVIGMFLYMAGTFFLFIYASTLSAKEVNTYWIINYISNILKNALFALAIVVHANEKPAQKSILRNN